MDPRSEAWAESGAMSLTGRREGPPLGVPSEMINLIAHATSVLHSRSEGRVHSDGLAILGERAAVDHLTRQGDISCGGSTRLVRAVDGWMAVCVARGDDIAALPAWLEREIPSLDPWPTVTELVAQRSVHLLDERAALLSLPFAALASVAPPRDDAFGLPVTAAREGDRNDMPLAIADAVVVDLSTLWAGPLCGQLLSEAGASVIKVESITRPDGARLGSSQFFDVLNGTKRSVALDLGSPGGRKELCRLLGAADIVIESARPRALEQFGILAADVLEVDEGPRVWVSITSHGRRVGQRDRVAFGDVAAAAGGLVVQDDQGPCFVADAVADPLTGLVAAAAVLEALADGGRWLLDAAMAPLAASIGGEPLPVAGAEARAPRVRDVVRLAPALGADTADVLAELR